MTCGQTMAYNIFGQYIPDSHCQILDSDFLTNSTDSLTDDSLNMNHNELQNATFIEMQKLIMLPKDLSKPNQENCKMNQNYSKLTNQSICTDYIFDDSIMTETIGLVQEHPIDKITCNQNHVIFKILNIT